MRSAASTTPMNWHNIWLILFLPLAGVLINGFVGHRLPRTVVAFIGYGVVAGAFALAVTVMWPIVQGLDAARPYQDFVLYQWISQDRLLTGEQSPLNVPIGIRVDVLSLTMVLVVTGVGFLIHFYSWGYMEHDPRFARYFAYLNLFTFAMLVLVLANIYRFMFVGWEGVGLCSFLLIGFWFERHSASYAAKKAFLVNRVGDFGFILGMLAIFATFGTFTYSEVFGQVANDTSGRFAVGAGILAFITAMLFIGACGKSAQWPLYLWLPDAMEGPTPVSALIHAATMVTAGVYMVARSAVLFSRAPVVEAAVAIIGVGTALFAALVAITQYDIKRVLAYSTVSQLGFMFVGVGVGAYAAGMYHLVTHAFFKALLFLAAGSVMHALADELDMRRMGGLKKWMPITWVTFMIGWLAIIGVPVIGSGFYSKDSILHAAMGRWPVIAWVGVLTAAITAFYMTRLYTTIFLGPSRYKPEAATGDAGHAPGSARTGSDMPPGRRRSQDPDMPPGRRRSQGGHGHGGQPHESPWTMWVPLAILGLLSAFAWVVMNGSPMPADHYPFASFLQPAFAGAQGAEAEHHGPVSGTVMAVISIIATLVGAGVAWVLHMGGVFARGWGSAGWARMFDSRFGYDWLMHFLFVRVGEVLARMVNFFIDQLLIDGLVNGVANLVAYLASMLRQLQTGFVRNYALVLLTGAVFVIICLMVTVQQR